MSLGYKNVVNTVVDRQKAAIALIGATDGGIWNCEEPSMALRFAQAAKDKVPEVSIFVLRADEPALQAQWGGEDPAQTFAALRAGKDNF